MPDGFDKAKTYPVLIGPGDGTETSDKSFFWNVPGTGTYGWILVEFPIWKESSALVAELMDHLKNEYHVEKQKFHMVGFSANSANTFKIALQIPEYFTSVTGIPGHPRTKDEQQIKKLAPVKIQNIVGEKDSYWLKTGEEYDAVYESLGIVHTLDVIPNGEHVLRHLIGDGFMKKMERMR